ncbi:MAG TPA: hypothetical protein VMU42_07560 [Candidatus Sulfotelmatobacter sp.]|nr:hypothetical protein [Candidatus Sulfotelmatobacter sp.]
MARIERIETTAGEITAELRRRGVGSDERVTVTLDLDRELIPGRRESRAHVVAAGLSDEDIDRLIKEAQRAVDSPA